MAQAIALISPLNAVRESGSFIAMSYVFNPTASTTPVASISSLFSFVRPNGRPIRELRTHESCPCLVIQIIDWGLARLGSSRLYDEELLFDLWAHRDRNTSQTVARAIRPSAPKTHCNGDVLLMSVSS